MPKGFPKGYGIQCLAWVAPYIALFEVPNLAIKPHIEMLSETGYMHFAFKIECGQFLLAVEKLRAKNINIGGGPVRRGDGDSVYFQDPDGNYLEIHCDDK